jgi:integrase
VSGEQGETVSIERVERKQGWVWRVRWRDERGRGRSRVAGTKRDAEALHAEIIRRKRLSGLGFIDDRGQTVGAFFESDWWKLYAAPNLAPRTLNGYAGLWRRHLAPRLADTRLQAVSPELVFLLRAELEAEGLGAPTITRALFLLQGVLRRAEQWERIQRNPVALVPKPPGRRRRFVIPLPPRGVEKIRRAAGSCSNGDEAATIISLMAYAGLRPQEVFGLTWRDIRDRTLLVDKAIDGSGGLKPTKTGRARTVRLLGPLAADLHQYRLRNAGGGEDGLLFSDPDGAPWRDSAWHAWHQSAWHPALKAAGVEYCRPYDLRHSFVSLLIQEGRSIVDVARQAGHSPTMTLDVYAHVFDDLDFSEHRSAENLIWEARGEEPRGDLVN